MKDVVFEWYIPYIPDRRKQLLKAILVSATVVCIFDAVFFAAGMLLPGLVLGAVSFFLVRSWKYEYEYVYVNGEFDVSKIIRKEKRKDVYHVDRPEIENITKGRAVEEGKPIRDFTSGRPNAPICTIWAKGELVYIEPSEGFLEEMKNYYRALSQ